MRLFLLGSFIGTFLTPVRGVSNFLIHHITKLKDVDIAEPDTTDNLPNNLPNTLPGDEDDATYSIRELLAKVGATLTQTFGGEIWIKGVIHNYAQAPSGHIYFSLCEKVENPGDTPSHTLSIALFKNSRAKIFGEASGIPKSIKLENGLEVKIRGNLGIYGPRSQLQLIMSQLDANWTISKLAENRELLLLKLKSEGLLELNGQCKLDPLPLKVALVTSRGSAAHHDFQDELLNSGYSWQIFLFNTAVQGIEAPGQICQALDAAAALKPDVIALVRGGGSMIDLAAFDDENVTRKVAKMPVPVFCGIGHEINTSIVDYVVHTSTKTPTACAQVLVAQVSNTESHSQEIFRQLVTESKHFLQNQQMRLTQISVLVADAPKRNINEMKRTLESGRANLAVSMEHIFKRQNEKVAIAQEQLDGFAQEKFKNARSSLKSIQKHIQTLSPQRFLQKGWSITRTHDGNLVRSPADAPANTKLHTQVQGGNIQSKVVKAIDEKLEERN